MPNVARVVVWSCWCVRTVDWGLAAQLLEHLRRSRQSISRLADRDIQDELLDAELFHRVVGFVCATLRPHVLAIGLLPRVLAFRLSFIISSCSEARRKAIQCSS